MAQGSQAQGEEGQEESAMRGSVTPFDVRQVSCAYLSVSRHLLHISVS